MNNATVLPNYCFPPTLNYCSCMLSYCYRVLGSGAIVLCLPFDLLGCFVCCSLQTVWGFPMQMFMTCVDACLCNLL